MQEVKVGSNWIGTERDVFTVIHRVELNSHIWIHYRNQKGQEFSCYEEAFLTRFRENTNDKRHFS